MAHDAATEIREDIRVEALMRMSIVNTGISFPKLHSTQREVLSLHWAFEAANAAASVTSSGTSPSSVRRMLSNRRFRSARSCAELAGPELAQRVQCSLVLTDLKWHDASHLSRQRRECSA